MHHGTRGETHEDLLTKQKLAINIMSYNPICGLPLNKKHLFLMGIALQEVWVASIWPSPHTFSRFYKFNTTHLSGMSVAGISEHPSSQF